jgi:hypothetical protein
VHYYKDEEEQDILEALSDHEVESTGLKVNKEFNILEYLTKSRRFNRALSLICTSSTSDEETLYCLDLEKLHNFLETKFRSLLELVKVDEGCSNEQSEKGAIQKWVEMLFSEIPSPVIAYSFLIKKLGMSLPSHLHNVLFPKPKEESKKMFRGSKKEMAATEKEMAHKESEKRESNKNQGLLKFFSTVSKIEGVVKKKVN